VKNRLLLRGGRVIDPASGRDGVADVLVEGEAILEVGRGLEATKAQVVDCAGLVVCPGFIDLHAHLREPGREDEETIETGCRAAALGGYTAVCAMPNTDPVADDPAVCEYLAKRGRDVGLADVYPVGAITVGLRGEALAEMGTMARSVAAVNFFSDDGHGVQDALLMRRALEYSRIFDGVIAEHCEDAQLAGTGQMNEGEVSALLGLAGWPAVAEEAMIARDVLLAELAGARLHVLHLSTAGAVDIVRRAKARNARITAEVTPHHLSLTEDLVVGYDPVYKVNPPLRTAADVQALRAGLADGTIDAIATDHAPHSTEEKEREFEAAPFGMLGLETALGVAITELVVPGVVELAVLVERLTAGPARVRHLSGHGGPLEAGRPANLTVFDPAREWMVDPVAMASRSRNTPWAGERLVGKTRHTLLRGQFTVRDGMAQR